MNNKKWKFMETVLVKLERYGALVTLNDLEAVGILNGNNIIDDEYITKDLLKSLVTHCFKEEFTCFDFSYEFDSEHGGNIYFYVPKDL